MPDFTEYTTVPTTTWTNATDPSTSWENASKDPKKRYGLGPYGLGVYGQGYTSDKAAVDFTEVP